MIYYGLEWQSLDTYLQMKEISVPDTPPANEVRLYSKDSGGVSKLFYKNDAGTEFELGTGTVSGSGSSGRVAYWTGASSLSGEDNLFWDATNNRLGIGTATPGVQTTAGRQYLSIIGSTLSGHVEFLTAEADADDVLIGGLQFTDKNSGLANKNRAAINANLSGATGNQRGAYLALYTSANAASGVTERARLTGGGQFGLGLGANTHTYKLEIWGANNDDSNFRIRTSTADTTGPGLNFQKSRGTALGSESAAQSADFLGAIGFGGYDGSAWQFNSVLMRAKAAELFSGSARGAHLLFETITAGGTTRSEKMRLASNGRLGIGSTDTVDPTVMLDIRGTGATVAVVAERDNGQPSFIGYRVRGGGTATQSGDMLALFGGGGSHTGATADRATTALFAVYAGENWGSGAKGAYCTIETTPTGSTTRAERWRVQADGKLVGLTGGSLVDAWDQANHVVGLNSTDPNSITTVPGYFVQGNSSVVLQMRAHGTAAAPVIVAQAARGTTASPALIQSADNMFAFNAYGQYDTTVGHFNLSCQMVAQATQNFSSTQAGGKWSFSTTPNGSTTPAARFQVPEDGGIAIQDGITAPATLSGWAKIYVDTADGDLKVKFGDGTVKTIVVDT